MENLVKNENGSDKLTSDKVQEIETNKEAKIHAEKLDISKLGQWSLKKSDELEKAGNPKIKSGFFTVDHLNAMDKAQSHADAKSIAHAAIDSQEGAHPTNVAKAKNMVNGSKSIKHLMIGAANFMLAHPSEGLGTGSKR